MLLKPKLIYHTLCNVTIKKNKQYLRNENTIKLSLDINIPPKIIN